MLFRGSAFSVGGFGEEPLGAGSGELLPCSWSSCCRNEVLMMLSNCRDSDEVNGTFGCPQSLSLEASDAAGRRRRWGVGWSIVLGGRPRQDGMDESVSPQLPWCSVSR